MYELYDVEEEYFVAHAGVKLELCVDWSIDWLVDCGVVHFYLAMIQSSSVAQSVG